MDRFFAHVAKSVKPLRNLVTSCGMLRCVVKDSETFIAAPCVLMRHVVSIIVRGSMQWQEAVMTDVVLVLAFFVELAESPA